ncbi:hypothetical protein GP2143_14896 [marine gamma proteobacterium HTCC2143]|jgi:hypothetical protein|uniref:Uncharacterized protein n=1 Tax=marine gamma proteobacterium HTCC2143 TaxID=247633 RepID=A0Y8U9_9GAMM|nr:hypothetical protein GP2143_14896 [marine gamma proteobacterium HTCC2143]
MADQRKPPISVNNMPAAIEHNTTDSL